MKKFEQIVAILIIAVFLLTSCGQNTPQATQQAQVTEAPVEDQPVTLKIGWLGEPDTLNPAYAFLVESFTIFDLIYLPLTVETPTGDYAGGLAKEWKHSDDGLTWTIKLKDGLKWHNGEALTADDIAWNLNSVINDPEGWAAVSGYVGGFTEAKALDDKTLEIYLDEPIGNMEYRLAFIYPVYPKDFQRFTSAEELQNFTNFNPIGSGAFKLINFDKDNGVLLLEANKDFVDGAPIIDQVLYQQFDNADALVQALKVGDIDMTPEVPNTAFETVKGFANVKALQLPGRSFTELIINSAPAVPLSEDILAPNRNPALEDPQVRLAMAYAINKQDLVDIVLDGQGQPGDTIVPPTLGGGFWHNQDIVDHEFDIAKANQILEEAGYVKGADGVRAKGDLVLDFRFQYPSDEPTYPRIADLISGWFAEAGIKATPEAIDPDSLIAATTAVGDFDLALWGWGSDPDPDFVLSVMTTEQYVPGGWADAGYSNPEYDELYRLQQVTVDRGERQKIIWKMQELVFRDKPYIVLLYSDVRYAFRTDRFKNFLEDSVRSPDSVWSLIQVIPVK